jgi:hypothetical protein
MLLALAQLGFIGFWIRTYSDAFGSVRVLLVRTAVVLGYGWFCAAQKIRPESGLSLVCEWLVWLHIGGLCMAVWNRDSRLFKHRYGGCQEN